MVSWLVMVDHFEMIEGGAGLLIGHPLDTIKARLQTSNAYRGIFDCALKTVKAESLTGLYKGMFAPFLSVGFQHSLLFVGYGFTLRLLHPDEAHIDQRRDLPITEIMMATMVASLAQMIPAIPIEHIKTKLQVQTENPLHFWQLKAGDSRSSRGGPLHCARQLLRQDGIRGLYKGGSAMFWRDIIGYMFYIPVYELLYRRLHRRKVNETIAQILAGGTAGSATWLSICPFEVVKNRMQVSSPTLPIASTSMLNTARLIYLSEGVRAFYRGGLVLVLRGFPVNAMLFVVYAKTMNLLQKGADQSKGEKEREKERVSS